MIIVCDCRSLSVGYCQRTGDGDSCSCPCHTSASGQEAPCLNVREALARVLRIAGIEPSPEILDLLQASGAVAYFEAVK